MDKNSESIDLLPNNLVKDTLVEIVAKNLNCKKYTLHVESGSSKGDNYIGVVYRAKAICDKTTENNNSHTKDKCSEISVIIKVPPQNAIRRKQFFARPCFLREALAYDELIPMFMKFQESKGVIPTENGFHEVPKCYRALTEDNYEAIFLKDLRPEGYEMFDRLDKISFDHVKLIVQILGKLHALSYAIKDQCPEKLKKYMDIEDIFASRKEDEALKSYMDTLKDRAIDALCPDKDKIIKDKVVNFFANTDYFQLLTNLVTGTNAEPHAVLCHGDCWNNNVLFKYKNGKPVDARLIDWQIARYASPVCDLMYYIFSCTTKELRDKHYQEIMNIYYNQLSTFLKRLGSDPEKVFPRKAFNDQLKRFGSFGLLMAMMLLPIITTHAEDIPDLDEMSERLEAGDKDLGDSFKPEKTMEIYKKRIRDVIIDTCELGYI